MDRKINKKIQMLNDTLDQVDLINIYRAFHLKAAEYISSQVHTEHSPEYITSRVTNQVSVNLRKIDYNQAFFPNKTL